MADTPAPVLGLHAPARPFTHPAATLRRHSLELTRRAWLCALSPSVKLVLLAYCLHASDRGLCWPSLARIASHTGLNPRTVQRHIRALEAAGALVPLSKPRAATQTYQINLQALGLVADALPRPPSPQPTLEGIAPAPDLDNWPELDFTLDLDKLTELGDALPDLPPLLPELDTPAAVDNLGLGGGNLYADPRQCVPQGVAICTPTPGTMPPKLYLTEQGTEEGTERAAHAHDLDALPAAALPASPASPASRFASPVLLSHTPEPQADHQPADHEPDRQTLARFAALHQRKGYGTLTPATLDALKAEGARIGLTLPQVLAHCVKRRWGTFKAAWLQPKHDPATSTTSALPAACWTLPQAHQPQRLSPDGERAARVLASVQAAAQCPPASPDTVASHRAKLAELRASYVAAGARVNPASAARAAALH